MTAYGDIGSQARAVLYKGYNESKFKVGLTTALPAGISVGISGFYDHISEKSDASLELVLNLNDKKEKVNFTTKRTFSLSGPPTFAMSVSAGDRLDVKNLGTSVNQSGNLGASYSGDYLNGNVGFNPNAKTVTETACASAGGFALGATSEQNYEEGVVKGTSGAIGYNMKTFAASANLDDDLSRGSILIYEQIPFGFEFAGKISRDFEKSAMMGEVGLRYTIDKGFTFSAKCLSDFQEIKVGFNLCKDFGSSVKTSASALVDINDLEKTKFGIGLDLSHDFSSLFGGGAPPEAAAGGKDAPKGKDGKEGGDQSLMESSFLNLQGASARSSGARSRKMTLKATGLRQLPNPMFHQR